MTAKVADAVKLLEQAQKRLDSHDMAFTEAVEVVLGILRSKGVVSHKRISLNGKYHRLLAASLVLAHEQNTAFALKTRFQQELHQQGVSTSIVKFLDDAVREGIICSQSPDGLAKGPQSLGGLITNYLEHLADTGVQT